MDQYQRGRSPSAAGHQPTSAHHSRSPSQNNAFTQQANASGFDPTLHQQSIGLGDALQQQQHQQFQNNSYSPQSAAGQQQFLSPQDAQHLGQFPQQQQQQQQQSEYSGLDLQNNSFDQSFDPSLVDDFTFANTGPEDSLSPNSIDMSTMTATMNPTSAPSDLSFQQDSFTNYSNPSLTQHPSPDDASRHQSLSPSSAGLPFGQAGREWAAMSSAAFRGHRRNQSDAYSDMSSNHSPYVDAFDSFDANGRSPMLNGQGDHNLPDQLGMGTFTLSENLANSQHVSPGHSQHTSPRISPQNSGFDNAGMAGPNEGLGLYPNNQMSEQFPDMGQQSDFDPTQHLDAPEINIQFAPERQPSFNEGGQPGQDFEALSPPARGSSRQRGRAISDPYANNIRRSASPGFGGQPTNEQNRNRNSSLSVHNHSRQSSISRSSSPGMPHPNGGVQKNRDRASSTGAIPAQREKIIGLVESNGIDLGDGVANNLGGEGGPKRTQKHPATFQCTLCPKRFTRAYNLRSHLRTHTDERPFVCSVCGKAFARQHDRKRHEGLHSGEKKFVCKGLLGSRDGSTNQGVWGCGRRFARADALGRHFRSEAGRTCIKPLLDEEARERRAAIMEQHSQDVLNSTGGVQPGLMPTAPGPGAGMPPGMGNEQIDMSNMTLPAVILAQYPALAGIQFGNIPAGPAEEDDLGFEASGRSSFEVSSGGEMDDDGYSGNEDWGATSMGNMGQQQSNQGLMAGGNAWNGYNQ